MLLDTSEHETKPEVSETYVQMYYVHQYDRMNELEKERLTLTNIVVTISIVAFTFGFTNLQNLTVINGIGLPVLIILFNAFAIIYVRHVARIIDTHGNRAKQILDEYAKAIFQLDKSMPWFRRGLLSRTNIHVLIHILIILTALLPVGVFFTKL